MDGNNCNSDKVTIKVKLSDEDYHDISIDWSNESFDYTKQIFHQLAAYTRLPIPYIPHVGVYNLNATRDVLNPEFKRLIPYESKDYYGQSKEYIMPVLNDGDCFLLDTRLDLGHYQEGSGLCSILRLVHRDLVDETECSHLHCNYLGSRAFTNIIISKIQSDYLQSTLDYDFIFRDRGYSGEFLNLKILSLLRLCCGRHSYYSEKAHRLSRIRG